MKTIFMIMLILFMNSHNVRAQYGWVFPNQSDGPNYKSINIFPDKVFCLEGLNLVKTTNAGLNWTYFSFTFSSIPTSLFFVDENLAFVSSQSGRIYKTTNGGINWSIDTGASSSNLNSIYFINANTGWTCGDQGINGTIYKTTNSGASWNQIYFTNFNLKKILFENNLTGYCCGGTGLVGKIYKTTDGGSTWAMQITTTDGYLNSSDFINVNTGWAVGAAGKILQTSDGGLHWDVQNSVSVEEFNSVYFVNKDSGWIAGRNAVILNTTNSGSTWNYQINPRPLIGTTVPRTLNDIKFSDRNTGFIAGEGFYNTTTGGAGWVTLLSGIPEDINSVTSARTATDTAIWGAGFNGKIIKSTDWGGSWKSQISNASQTLNSIDALNPDYLFCVGDNGIIRKNLNGDTNWIPVTSPTNTKLNSVFINSTDFIFSGGDNGIIYRSSTGGLSWDTTILTTQNALVRSLRSIHFPSPDKLDHFNNTGFVAFNNGIIFKTTDNGLNWFRLDSITTENLNSVYAIDENVVFSAGNSGTIIKSTNGGSGWFQQTSGTNENLNSIIFTGFDTGYIAGNNRTILQTVNGGTNWILITGFAADSKALFDLNSITFVNNMVGWTVGDSGKIFGTADGGLGGRSGLVSIQNQNSYIQNYALYQNYPNPFNPSTKIKYSVSQPGMIHISVYNSLGQLITNLVNDYQLTGKYEIDFNGSYLPSGVYFYKINLDQISETKKMILVR